MMKHLTDRAAWKEQREVIARLQAERAEVLKEAEKAEANADRLAVDDRDSAAEVYRLETAAKELRATAERLDPRIRQEKGKLREIEADLRETIRETADRQRSELREKMRELAEQLADLERADRRIAAAARKAGASDYRPRPLLGRGEKGTELLRQLETPAENYDGRRQRIEEKREELRRQHQLQQEAKN